LFGDSYVHGDEVSFNASWVGYFLEYFKDNNYKVEIMNFGVGAFGNDQAYLRWKYLGEKYKPDIVVIGFQEENCDRNLNLIRKFYFRGSGIPFSKPRFVLSGTNLSLINFPTVPYKEVPNLVKDFEQSPLREYETFYKPEEYHQNWFNKNFKSINAILAVIQAYYPISKKDSTFDAHRAALCYAVFNKFVSEASEKSTVIILHLPIIESLKLKMENKPLAYEKLLSRLTENFTVVDPTEPLVKEANKFGLDSLFVGHYSAQANTVIGKVLFDHIINNLEIK